MKHLITIFLFAAASSIMTAAAPKSELPYWQDPSVLERNRAQMTASFTDDGARLMLNGTWKFCWYQTINAKAADFFSESYDDSAWDTIPVPGMWELNGYGDPVYVNTG
ncbi:MAG: hypothetical protein PUC72_05450, partial [Bacteroidales bacterium]|nr:hypothetical protein [Bacteroidales bacterium]